MVLDFLTKFDGWQKAAMSALGVEGSGYEDRDLLRLMEYEFGYGLFRESHTFRHFIYKVAAGCDDLKEVLEKEFQEERLDSGEFNALANRSLDQQKFLLINACVKHVSGENLSRRFLKDIKNENSVHTLEQVTGYPDGVVHDYQEKIVSTIQAYFEMRPKKGGLVALPTGAGKTLIALQVLIKLLKRHDLQANGVVWITQNEALAEQVILEFKKWWTKASTSTVFIRRFYGNHKKPPKYEGLHDTFMVAGIKKLGNVNEMEEYFSHVGLIIVDEVHTCLREASNETVLRLKNANNADLLGLTATLNPLAQDARNLNENYEVLKVLDIFTDLDQKAKGPVDFLIRKQVLSRPDFIEIKDPLDLQITNIMRASSEERNDIIVQTLMKLIEEGHGRILVFACSVDHARLLNKKLILNGVRAGYVTCERGPEQNHHTLNGFHTGEVNVLLNFQMVSTGFDCPQLDAVFLTRPTESDTLHMQIIGRGFRGVKHGGTKTFKVLKFHTCDFGSNLDLDAQFRFLNPQS